jgi:DNA-binding NarL/FixJ family response regulator
MNKTLSDYILVIEDEPIIREKIVKKLSSFIDSEKIKLAVTVKDSLELLDTYKFNIIILDLNLSDSNGVTILNKLKKDNLKSLVYVFSINSELKKICIKKGATAFFDKSKDFSSLISTVKTSYQNIVV